MKWYHQVFSWLNKTESKTQTELNLIAHELFCSADSRSEKYKNWFKIMWSEILVISKQNNETVFNVMAISSFYVNLICKIYSIKQLKTSVQWQGQVFESQPSKFYLPSYILSYIRPDHRSQVSLGVLFTPSRSAFNSQPLEWSRQDSPHTLNLTAKPP